MKAVDMISIGIVAIVIIIMIIAVVASAGVPNYSMNNIVMWPF